MISNYVIDFPLVILSYTPLILIIWGIAQFSWSAFPVVFGWMVFFIFTMNQFYDFIAC